MKLELKHLAGYLPYGLKLERINYKNERFKQLTAYDLCPDGEIENIKPILRPLSDLIKKIEVNGEKFVPIERLDNNFRPNSKDLNICMFANELSIDIDTQDYSQCIDLADGFRITQRLLEWHFDIYGLIENGLAIDINTIK